jgi:drug/metabolite transporter (DMT)-like permease
MSTELNKNFSSRLSDAAKAQSLKSGDPGMPGQTKFKNFAQINNKDSSSPWPGTLVCVASMCMFTITNATLRYLGELGATTDWVIVIKESFAVFVLFPWILFRFFQGRYHWQSKRLVLVLIGSGIVCHIFGSQNHLYAYTLTGLVIAVPLIHASQILAAALLGYFFLKDYISRIKWASISLLLLSLGLLCTAEMLLPQAEDSKQQFYFLGGFLAVVAGCAYAIHAVLVRYVTNKYWKKDYTTWQTMRFYDWIGHDFSIMETNLDREPAKNHTKRAYSPFPVTLVMVIINGVGMLYFGSSVIATRGVNGFVDVPSEWWFWIIFAAATNMIGFFFQVQGLLMVSAAKLTLITATQIIILTVLGILLFGEPMNLMIALGILCATLGVLLSTGERK